MNIWIAFITGLTAGGLSCLAVQGGLLASSLAVQLEQDLQQGGKNGQRSHQIARPILFFLLAKLIAYTLLGFLLGLLGSVLQLTPMMRAVPSNRNWYFHGGEWAAHVECPSHFSLFCHSAASQVHALPAAQG